MGSGRLYAAAASAALAVALLLLYAAPGAQQDQTETAHVPERADAAANQTDASPVRAHVTMPTKSSRPGCELEMECYVPHTVRVGAGQGVVWENLDAAFHSVTSGEYGGEPELFDSGHMDPGGTFSYVFGDAGVFEYHCTLHPWMEGVVEVVE